VEELGSESGGGFKEEPAWLRRRTGRRPDRDGDGGMACSDTRGRERGAASDRLSGRRPVGALWRGCGARPCRPGAACGTLGGGSALTSGPGVEREELTGGTPRQILIRIKNTPERKIAQNS
jgi:hypothetical protein